MREQAVKQQAEEKRRAERRQRHLQDDLRYALKKMAEPLDLSISFEDVGARAIPQAIIRSHHCLLGYSSDARPAGIQSSRG